MPCQHNFDTHWAPDYEVCSLCDTLRSMTALPPEELYAEHWNGDHGTVWEQVWNVDMHTENGVSKNRFVLDRLESKRGAALDIGCAPGRMLYWLKYAARFETVSGVEPSDHAPIRKIGCFDGVLLKGLFPECTGKLKDRTYDLIVSLDTFEHVIDPEAFLSEANRLLAKDGQLFLMLPLADGLEEGSRFLDPLEHVWLHSKSNLGKMLCAAGLSSVKWDRWTHGHDTVSARKWG